MSDHVALRFMAHDGCAGLSPDGWLPDRIAVGILTSVFPPDLVDAAVAEAGAREQRRRLLPARLVVYFTLALWLFRSRNCGYGQVMMKLADGLYHQRQNAGLLESPLGAAGSTDDGQGRQWRQPNISNMARGRGKLGPGPLHNLFLQVAGPTGAVGAPAVCCCGLRIVSIDGTVTDVPDSKANDEHFGRPANQRSDGSFPQVRWVAAAESRTGSLLGAALGPYPSGDPALTLGLLGCLGHGQLVLADGNFLPWSLARDVLATGAHILWRAASCLALRSVQALADGSYLAELRPPGMTGGPAITVRVIEYTVLTARAGSQEAAAPEVFRLVTDLIDPDKYPAVDLACCYPERWRCEAVIGRHKADMGEGLPVLRSKDPAGVAQEMWALFAVYQALCKTMGTGAATAGISPARIGFPSALAARDSRGEFLSGHYYPFPAIRTLSDPLMQGH
jgi:hypothetical protein